MKIRMFEAAKKVGVSKKFFKSFVQSVLRSCIETNDSLKAIEKLSKEIIKEFNIQNKKQEEKVTLLVFLSVVDIIKYHNKDK